MNRTQFQNILESIIIPEGCDPVEMQTRLKPLNIALLQMCPSSLFRYRTCATENIDAFQKDQVWLSTADKFNDPFDTLLQYDLAFIQQVVDEPQPAKVLEAMTRYIAQGASIPEKIAKMFPEDYIQECSQRTQQALEHNEFQNILPERLKMLQIQLFFINAILPQWLQQNSITASFSEDVNSILMWSHYAENHKGFAVEYDPHPYLFPNPETLCLFPIIYSDKRYDATQYSYYLISQFLQAPSINIDQLRQFRLMLYKSTDWAYEREWRLIGGNANPPQGYTSRSEPHHIPAKAIYYGCRITEENQEKLHAIAQEKHIPEYQMKIDYANSTYRIDAHILK